MNENREDIAQEEEREASSGSLNETVEKEEQIKETRSVWSEIYEWIDTAVITVVCILLIFTFVFKQVVVEGDSMYDTLQNGERVIVSDVFYKPQYGDIVVISNEVYGNTPLIKRIIATEGQWVDIKDGTVYVGDTKETLEEKGNEFTNALTKASMSSSVGHSYPLQVPEGTVFVLGDNRTVSLDSRTTEVGFVDANQIIGKALYRVFPMDRIGNIYNQGNEK